MKDEPYRLVARALVRRHEPLVQRPSHLGVRVGPHVLHLQSLGVVLQPLLDARALRAQHVGHALRLAAILCHLSRQPGL